MLTDRKIKVNDNKVSIVSSTFVKGIIGHNNSILFDGKKQIAFIGRSNVGKSSVINTLVNKKDLAKSSSTPGKTKEINFFLINNSFYFVDLPGYGYAKLSLKIGDKLRKRIIWYFSEEKIKPKFIILIIDSRIGITKLDKEMLEILEGEKHEVILLLNKSDKLSKNELTKKLENINKDFKNKKFVRKILPFSSKTKVGRKELLNVIFE